MWVVRPGRARPRDPPHNVNLPSLPASPPECGSHPPTRLLPHNIDPSPVPAPPPTMWVPPPPDMHLCVHICIYRAYMYICTKTVSTQSLNLHDSRRLLSKKVAQVPKASAQRGASFTTKPFLEKQCLRQHGTVRPTVRPSDRPFVRSSVRTPVRLSVRSFVRSSFRPSDHPSVGSSVRPFVNASDRPVVRPSVRSFDRSSVRLSVRSSVRSSILPTGRPTACQAGATGSTEMTQSRIPKTSKNTKSRSLLILGRNSLGNNDSG